MIRMLKLQKAMVAFILGVLALVAYRIMTEHRIESSKYVLSLSGFLFVSGALMFLYPIVVAKKVKEEDCVELDPEKQEEV
jgi:membrane protein CcdC involved in cytochrome C biogenesis